VPTEAPLLQRTFTSAAEGDFSIEQAEPELTARRTRVAPVPWTWLTQVHGDRVMRVSAPAEHQGARADASVTDVRGAALAVQTADCVPVLLADESAGVIGAAHAGWRGLETEVVQRTVEAMTDLGARRVTARVGPCICAECYEFGQADLTRLALRYGPDVVGATTEGTPGFDLRAATSAALVEAGVSTDRTVIDDRCTATAVDDHGEFELFSWRARQDQGRQTSVIWLP
jgi:YfiH family protein